jgi:hypothetical protein
MTVLTVEQPAIPAGWRWVLRTVNSGCIVSHYVILQKPVNTPCGFRKRKTKPEWEWMGSAPIHEHERLNPSAHIKSAQRAWDSYQEKLAKEVRDNAEIRYIWKTL